MNGARHVTGCHSTQDTRVQDAFDDVASSRRHVIGCCVTQKPGASTIHQSLLSGEDEEGPGGQRSVRVGGGDVAGWVIENVELPAHGRR